MQKLNLTDLKLNLTDLLGAYYHHENDMTLSGRYFWNRKRFQVADLVRKNIHIFSSLYGEDREFKCVDIGCGTGVDLLLIRQLLKPHFTQSEFIGLEGNQVHYELSNLRKKYFNLDDIKFKIVDLTIELPFDDNSVDFVYCSEVVEHILEPEKLLEEISRILQPNGVFVLTTPNEPNIFQKAFWFSSARSRLKNQIKELKDNPRVFQMNGKDICVYGHVSCRKNKEWDKLLENEGLSLIDYRRGAVVYGGTEFHDRNFMLALKFVLETFLDVLPKQLTRDFSCQLIALYQLQREKIEKS